MPFIRAAAPPLTGAACRIRFSKIFSGGKRFSALHVCALRLPSVEYLDFEIYSGVPMPRYLTQHTLACLTRQGAETLARRMQSGGSAHAERVLVNMVEGKMFVEFRAETREVLEAWLKTEGMHFDWLVRIEWEMRDEGLRPAA